MFLTKDAGNDSGYLAIVAVNALIDLLIQKKVITHTDLGVLLTQLKEEISQGSNAADKRLAPFFPDRMQP
jgi:hypothetical protein